jgi:hypothetical protein
LVSRDKKKNGKEGRCEKCFEGKFRDVWQLTGFGKRAKKNKKLNAFERNKD